MSDEKTLVRFRETKAGTLISADDWTMFSPLSVVELIAEWRESGDPTLEKMAEALAQGREARMN